MKHTIGLSFQVRMGENQKYKQGPGQPLTPDSESTLLEFSRNKLKYISRKYMRYSLPKRMQLSHNHVDKPRV
jgi:hypothetical protein